MTNTRKKVLMWVAAAAAVMVTTLLCCAGAGKSGLSSLRGNDPAPSAQLDAPNRSPIGINLFSPSYWSQNYPFVDAMKAADGFISGSPEHADPSKHWKDDRTLALSERGWVTKLEPGQVARVFILGGDTPYPTGRITVLYEGAGDIEYKGRVSGLKRAPGKDTFELGPQSGLFLNITRIDPANPLRDIRVLLPGGRCEKDPFKACQNDATCDGRCVPFEETYEQAPFHPSFLSDVRAFGTLRFMDWMQTNRERILTDGVDEPLPISSYDDYPTRAHAQWHPVPVEIMVELSNLLKAHPWFTMPHQATDDFVRRFATDVHKTLDPSLKVHLEYSNEAWNDQFDQHQWMNAEGCRTESKSPKKECDPDHDGTLCEYGPWNDQQAKCAEYGSRFFARRTVEMVHIFEEVFGDQADERLVRILGGQIGAVEWRGRPQLELKVGGRPVYEQVDAYGIAAYLPAPEKFDTIDDLFARVDEETNGAPAGTFRLLSGAPGAEYGGPYTWIAKDMAILRSGDFGDVTLIGYEGGQHFHNYDEATMDRLLKANRDPRMKDVYLQLLTAWSELTGGAPFVHFSSPSVYNQHGAWGSKEFQGQALSEAPKHDALLTAIAQQRKGAQSK